jgi:2-polyprenyl-3-methyl-5-hydroxy-6-metoxy-1,4-benzoquinol methylase
MWRHTDEVASGKRFEFGKNWVRFLGVLNNERIAEAEKSLKKMLEVDNLAGNSFLDIGSGSGLFSLAARRLGARVHSFDCDPQSVECTVELRRRFFSQDTNWIIEEGSVLDQGYIESLGVFDIVYSWGVLHHTGLMWQAIENAAIPVKPGGKLYISIYNDQGGKSVLWRFIKKAYCSGFLGRLFILSVFIPYYAIGGMALDILRVRNPLKRYSDYKKDRGMSHVHDWIDWLGGYPFEVAKPEDIFYFLKPKGFILEQLKTWGGGAGCNEYVFRRS